MSDWTGMFDHHLDVAPPLSDEQLRQVPAKRGVLLLAGQGGEPITMITAGALRSRLTTRLAEPHEQGPSRIADLRQITRTVWWKLTPSHFETDLCFLTLAGQVWPKRFASMVAVKPPWFVRVDCDEQFPHFARTRDVLGAGGQAVGPLPTSKAGDQFVQVLQDAFDLCRDIKCLRTSPNGQPCAYAQMGRCLSPCDGTIAMADYRQVVQAAARFAAGDRQPRRDELTEQMRQVAAGQKYELAGAIRTRLERIAQLDGRDYRFVAPATDFAFLLIQRGHNSRLARAFCVHGPKVADAGQLDYPLVDKQLASLVKRMQAGPGDCAADSADPWRMGLVTQYLFSGEDRRGVIIPWRSGIAAGDVAEAIEASTRALKLRAPAKRAKAGKAGKAKKTKKVKKAKVADKPLDEQTAG